MGRNDRKIDREFWKIIGNEYGAQKPLDEYSELRKFEIKLGGNRARFYSLCLGSAAAGALVEWNINGDAVQGGLLGFAGLNLYFLAKVIRKNL